MKGKFVAPAGGAVDSDAGIYLFGRMQRGVQGPNVGFFNEIALLNSDLTIDTSFNPGSGFSDSGGQARPLSIIELPDGKILVGAAANNYNGTAIGGIVKLNLNGTIDTSFVTGTGFNLAPRLILQPDGKVIAFGQFTTYNGTTVNRVVRLNANGSIDSSFVIGTGFNTTVNDALLQSDGKIIFFGAFTTYNSITANRIIRVNSDGSIDSSFNPGTGANTDLNRVAARTDGKIYVGSGASGALTYNGNSINNKLFRINTDGSFDNGFTSAITYTTSQIERLIATSDDGVIVCGSMSNTLTNPYAGIYKHLSTGARDTNFAMYTGAGRSGVVRDIKPYGVEKYLICGNFFHFNSKLSRNFVLINSNGTVDSVSPFTLQDFSINSGIFNSLEVITPLSSGKIVIGGWPMFISEENSNISPRGIVKLSSYNTIDKALSVNSVASLLNTDDFRIKGLRDSSKSAILINDTSPTSTTGNYFRGIGADLETIANINKQNFIEGGYVYDIIKLSSGGYFFCGAFRNYEIYSRTGFVKTDSNFNIDLTFNNSAGTTVCHKSIEQPSGRIVVVGTFSSPQGRIMRLNSDGTRDTTFTASFTGTAYDIVAQPDGQLIVGGVFSQGIRRINGSNGATDTSFVVGTGFASAGDGGVWTLYLQPDGKILVGGAFTSYNGQSRNRILRLNTNGSIDETFNIGSGFNGRVMDIKMDSSGKIYVGGDFTSYNGVDCLRYCVLDSNGAILPANIYFNDRVDSILIIE